MHRMTRLGSTLRRLALPLLALLLVGCAAAPPYDYTALRSSAPRSIVVLPPINNSIEVDAPYIYLSTITRPLAEKGYYVYPVAMIDTFLKENGLPGPEEMHGIPLDKIREHIGADAVLYVTIDEWGQKYQVVSSTTVVRAHMRLVDTRTGAQLWDATAFAQQSSSDSNQGIVLAMIVAVIEQVASSITDNTPGVARSANNMAINSANRGLLNGPYLPAAGNQ